ncbi:hypothetical protein BDP55DRAFT_743530 [Colletotrichum godetiae]|uniref:Uncharacterized protein n=1 Tax=Colletotrichum godetiae TaxID=1209918 RepID=A0AAJ0B0S9_9PEZI|nr:uncharacterized protein BDP55DRAFT_743530 [Colletotrichum godetiae]KAK1700519.1 hypothetical protein BDP55DRAFT_743530 [Colletotrichum godetiae]
MVFPLNMQECGQMDDLIQLMLGITQSPAKHLRQALQSGHADGETGTSEDQYVRSLKKVLRASDFRVSFVDLPGPGPLGHPCDPCRGAKYRSPHSVRTPPPENQRGPTQNSVPGNVERERAGISETGGERSKRNLGARGIRIRVRSCTFGHEYSSRPNTLTNRNTGLGSQPFTETDYKDEWADSKSGEETYLSVHAHLTLPRVIIYTLSFTRTKCYSNDTWRDLHTPMDARLLVNPISQDHCLYTGGMPRISRIRQGNMRPKGKSLHDQRVKKLVEPTQTKADFRPVPSHHAS